MNADHEKALRWRVGSLEALYAAIARTRMAGLPLLNTAVEVEAIGFELARPQDDGRDPCGLGVLITPWFMNLVRLPLHRDNDLSGLGQSSTHRIGRATLAFIGGHEPGIGAFASCSLFSPMFEFASHAVARDTALAVLGQLREAVPAEPRPARRSFLFGRRALEVA